MVTNDFAVRRIAREDGDLLRSIRLAAIADSPGTYATTLEEARNRPSVGWERVAETSAEGGDQATWFAEAGDDIAGMVSAFRTADDIVTLTSLWAAPKYRDVGVADSLVDAGYAWAQAIGAVQ